MPVPRRPPALILGALLLLMAVSAVVVLHAGRGTIFFFDEWDFIDGRRGVSADTLLRDHNGHLSLVPVAIYKVFLQLFGLTAYWPYRLLLVLLHLTACGVLFAAVRRRVGDVTALCAAALVLFLGAAADDLIWAFQIGFVGSVASGLAMLVALDRRTGRGDLVATAMLALSLASSSIGIPFLIIAAVELAVGREPRRLARIVGVCLALYLVWRVGYGHSDLQMDNADDAPAYVFQMVAAALGGGSGLGAAAGPTLALAFVAFIAHAVVVRPPSPRLVAVITGAAALWGLTALARAQGNEPGASRYIYASVVLVILALAETRQGRPAPSPRAVAVLLALTAVAVVGNLLPLQKQGDGLRATSENVKARLSALEATDGAAPPDFRPAPEGAPQIVAGQYLSAVRAFGSPAEDEQELAADDAEDRAAADLVLSAIVPPVTQVVDRPARVSGCRRVPPGVDVPLPEAGRVTVLTAAGTAPGQVLVRRFGSDPVATPIATTSADRALEVATAEDAVDRPWQIRVTSPTTVCPA